MASAYQDYRRTHLGRLIFNTLRSYFYRTGALSTAATPKGCWNLEIDFMVARRSWSTIHQQVHSQDRPRHQSAEVLEPIKSKAIKYSTKGAI
jgi:hypothetical protein